MSFIKTWQSSNLTQYLTVSEILIMHHKLVEVFGGAHGVRDMGAVDAACHRPQMGYYKNILEEAAALMERLAMNHPFVDGNKRIAFAAKDVFLGLNGYKIISSSAQIYAEMMKMFDSNSFEFKNILIMLEKITVNLDLKH